jgi:hypothetical protein
MGSTKKRAEMVELAPLVNSDHGMERTSSRLSRSTEPSDEEGDALLPEYDGGIYEGNLRGMRKGVVGWRRVCIVVFCSFGVIFLFLAVFLGILFLAGTFSRLLLFEETTPSPWIGWQDIRYLFILYIPSQEAC